MSQIDQTTEIGTWISLVKEGERATGITLGQIIESYTVFMLMRNIHNTKIFDDPVALMVMKKTEETTSARKLHLAKAGDCALIIAGLFPERHKKAHVSEKYFTAMSQIAYLSLSDLCNKTKKIQDAKEYATIAENVEKIAYVLQGTRMH